MINEYIKDDGNIPARAKIGGTSYKIIVDVKSTYLKKYVKEVKFGNKNYYSYANESIQNGDVPEYIKAVIKAPRGSNISFLQNNDHIFNEILGSRIANEMDIKTVYAIDMSINQRPHAILLYFLNENDTITDFNDFSGINDDMPLLMSQWHTKIVDAFNYRHPDMPESERNALIRNFLESFVEMYFFKTFIIKDGDFSSRNVAVINDRYLSVCHDNEMGFDALCKGNRVNQDEFNDFADYASKNFPEIYNKLIYKTNYLSRHLNDIISADNIYDEEQRTRLHRFCTGSLSNLLAAINEYQKEREGM